MAEPGLGSLKDEFPDKYLFAEDLKGKPVDLTIAAMNSDSLVTEAGKKRAVVVTFAGKKKVLVLNKTNAHLINEIFPLAPGESMKSWVGKRITIYPTQTKMKGEVVDCIRVYGSLDLAADKKVWVKQGFSKVAMTLHAVKASPERPTSTVTSATTGAVQTTTWDAKPDESIIEAWVALGWTQDEGQKDWHKWTLANPGGTDYLAHLSTLIDQMNAEEAS
jgi:hypothetical protein